jgi:hypothetical protein
MARSSFIAGIVAFALVGHSAAASEGTPRNAFWFEGRLALGTVLVGAGGVVPMYQPSLTVGGRLAGRVNLGLGVALFRLASNNTATTTFTFQPTATVDLVKAADERVAFYVRGGLPLGAVVPSTGRTLVVVGYDVALGVRYAPHPMFALGVEGGLFGSFSDPGVNSIGNGIQSVYGALTGNFFYGK